MSITFNGTNQYLERTATVGASFPLTISAWFKTNSTTTAQVLWSESSTTGQSRHSFYIDTDSKLKCATVDTGGILYTAVSTNSVTTNWHHGAAYFASNSNRSIFLDAVVIVIDLRAFLSNFAYFATTGATLGFLVASARFLAISWS